MFKNYLKVAFQILFRNGIYSVINILGLGIGLACCLLILLFVRFELSYEKSFTNADRVYRISKEIFPQDGARLRVPASNNGPVAQALLEDFPEIEAAGRFYGGTTSLKFGEDVFDETAVRFTDQGTLQVFSFDWLAGDSSQALTEPGSIVLTESLARRIFGSTEVLGESLEVPGAFELRVTGIIRDIPANSHLSLTGMVSMNTRQVPEDWNSNTDFHTYFLLAPDARVENLEAKMPDFLDRHLGEGASTFVGMSVMNIRDIHLYSDRDEEWKAPGSMANVYSFSAIALAVLVIACINFMSIATSRSSQRSREIGARLAVGATRRQLMIQFLGESAVTSVLSMVLAIVVVEVLLPPFSSFVGNPLAFDWFSDSDLLLALLALTVFVAFFSGSYPALYLSAMKPAAVLKGAMGQGKSSLWLRNSMVMVQFAIAITLVVSTAVIYLQRQYAVNIDMGFEKDRIVVMPAPTPQGYSTDWPALSQAMLAESAIESVTASHYLPFGFNDNQIPLRRRGTTIETRIQYMQVGNDFFETYEIETLAGRVFSAERGTDSLVMPTQENPGRVSFVLNESGAAALGINPQAFTEEALEINGMPIAGSVIGIVADTYFESIRRDVRPMIFLYVPPEMGRVLQRYPSMAIRISAGDPAEAMRQIDRVWKSFYPGRPNNSYFLDTDFRALYESEERQGQLLTWFSTIAIVIACFGLFGLASFNAERRTKEIGVRKVMGGSVWSIVLLLTNDFSKLVLFSNLIAWPVAYVVMNRWLENFAYRIDLTPLIFIGSGLITLCIAWVTVGGTAAKAASRKPVLALRYEY